MLCEYVKVNGPTKKRNYATMTVLFDGYLEMEFKPEQLKGKEI